MDKYRAWATDDLLDKLDHLMAKHARGLDVDQAIRDVRLELNLRGL